jgi:multimeric flavodoxin WrbA
MKIVTLIGSYRKKGNTARIVEKIGVELRIQAAALGENMELETVFLGEQNIGFCRGCRACFDRGEERCPLKDDLLPLKARLQVADAIIAASPVYVDDVSGLMKNWIDRMAHLCHRPGLPGKPVYLLASTGTTPTGRALDTLSTAFSTWGCVLVGRAGFVAGALLPGPELEAGYTARCRAIAARIFQAARGSDALDPSFRSLLTFRIQQMSWRRRLGEDTLDARYWCDSGWTQPRRDFYVAHRAGWWKVALAGLAANLIAPFMLK